MYLELRAPSDNDSTSIAHQHSKEGLSPFKYKKLDNLREALTNSLWHQATHQYWLIATPWTVACQAPLSMGFSRQEYGPPGDIPNPGTKPKSPVSCIGRWFLYHWATWEATMTSEKGKFS